MTAIRLKCGLYLPNGDHAFGSVKIKPPRDFTDRLDGLHLSGISVLSGNIQEYVHSLSFSALDPSLELVLQILIVCVT